MNPVEFQNVTRVYPGGSVALREVSLSFEDGTVAGLVGRNGAGKTTLLRMIPALLHPTGGTVRVFGMDPWQAQQEVKRQLGYLSEDHVLPGQLRIRDMTDLCASVYPGWDSQMASQLLGQFGLDEKRRIGVLSKGQKRQVGLLMAVCHRPRLLVLDEPAGGLDPVVRRGFLEVVIDLLASSGSTVILSSHILSDLERVAEQLVVLHEGRVLLQRPVDELKENTCRVEIKGQLPSDADTRLAAHPDCVRAVRKNGGLQATLVCSPEGAASLVGAALDSPAGIEIAGPKLLGLEDIFIDLTGDRA
jgi:ABC-2 type transport system ATP-binding protein